ncbi:uncharacterized protein V6R79_011716 [Siganus canaliculatus]
MSATTRRLFTGLTCAAFRRGIFSYNATSTVRPLNNVRSLALSSHKSAKSTDDNAEVNHEPIRFSTSKASHKTWRVEGSMGSQFQRPWWKVLPVSLFTISFLLWCALRKETEIDGKLEQNLYKHLPGLLSDEEEEENKTS